MADLNTKRSEPAEISEPMVSVVLTTYRQEAYIEQAIRSAAEQQTNFPIEILVGEDGSPDGTRAVCERLAAEFPNRVTLFAHEKNIGGHDNFNFLWTRARGKYVAWLEGDDYWIDPLKLQTQVDAMERTPEAALCFHNTQVYIEGDGPESGSLQPGLQEEMMLPFSHLVFANRIMTCSALYRRGLVPALPAWVWPLDIGDWPMHLMHAAQGPALFLPQTMAAYRMHTAGVWSHRPLRERVEKTIEALEAVRLNVSSSLQQLCAMSIAGFQREIEICRQLDVIEEQTVALAQARTEAEALRAALSDAQAEAARLAIVPEAPAPAWRRAWRRVWRPIYRRLKLA
jgi:hypothetical protein